MSLRPTLLALAVFLALPNAIAAIPSVAIPDPAINAPYMRFPSAHGDQLVFTAEGDLWRAALQGGLAQRLTTFRGEESQAAISPDGQQVAFLANYDGPTEVYVMPLTGGVPRRVSFESTGSSVLGWTAQGEVMYSVQSTIGPSMLRVLKLVSPSTLQRRTLPLHDVTDASIDASGKTVFFSRLGLSTRSDNARRYRGGAMSQLWRFDIGNKQGGSTSEARRLSTQDAVDKQPMWFQGRVYFISDRDGSDNLWSMLPDGSDAKQLSFERAFDVRNASLNAQNGSIVYQLGADVKAVTIANGQAKVLPLRLQSDFEQVRERVIAQPLEYLSHSHLGHTGERVALTVRGKIFIVGLSSSRRQEVAIPPGSRARNAVLAPDGKTVYAICDASGEQEIWRFSVTGGLEQAKQLSSDAPAYRTGIALSPDGKKLAHANKEGQIFILDLQTNKNSLVQEMRASDIDNIQWSPNSAMLAITRESPRHPLSQVWLYDLASNQLQSLTSDKYPAHSPSFSPDGKWLYVIGERTFQALSSSPWGDRQMGPFFDKRGKIYAYALQAGLQFPFQTKTELDGTTNSAPAANAAKKEAPSTDLASIASRLFEVPAPAANYRTLENDGKRLYWLEVEAGGENYSRGTVKSLQIDNNGANVETLVSEVSELSLSGDQKKMLLKKFSREGAGDLLLLDAGGRVTDAGKQTINLKNWSLSTQPALEWQQMFDDAWRMQRDFFFDRNMRGIDWQQMRQKYRPLVARVRDKYELNDLLAQMMSELGALHSQIVPGDVRKADPLRMPSFLGGNFERMPTGFRIDHIYRYDSELPNERSPLAQHDFQIGDVITHINNRSVLQVDDIATLLTNQGGQQVLIHYQRQGQEKPKSAVVTPVNMERNATLRYNDWEWARQQQVAKASQGRIGYLHVRQMLGADLNNFARDFYANIGREGLVIDVRRNNGGAIDSWIVEKLLRRAWGYWQRHNGAVETHPQQSFRGHLVVLTDELTYSDGETFAAAVKALGLATVIGQRTAGAGVWLSDGNNLLDKGRARAAETPQYMLHTGQWHIEGVGVSPDIKVDNLPHASYLGQDAQLEAALDFLSKKIKETPIPKLQAQPIPKKN